MPNRVRSLIAAGLVTALSASVIACGSSDSPDETAASTASTSATSAATDPASKLSGTLAYADYGGHLQDGIVAAWMDPWNKTNPGVKVDKIPTYDPAKLKAMVQTGNVTWDLVGASPSDSADPSATLEKIDCSVVNCDGLPDQFDGYRVPNSDFAAVVAYNNDKVGTTTPAQGWKDFYDTKKYPGKRGMYAYPVNGQIEGALLADGVTPEDLYPLDFDRAFKKMDSIKKDIVFWQTGAQCTQLVSSGEVAMADCWQGEIPGAVADGAPIGIDWDGCLYQYNYFGIPKGAKNADAAMNFIAYATDAKNNGNIMSQVADGPAIEGAVVPADSQYKDDVPTAHMDTCVLVDAHYLGEHAEELYKRFNDWTTG